jgi:hypothetical protein
LLVFLFEKGDGMGFSKYLMRLSKKKEITPELHEKLLRLKKLYEAKLKVINLLLKKEIKKQIANSQSSQL